MTDNTQLFSRKSEDYSQFRPAYPDAAAVWLKSRIAGDTVVDIGAGTGIFTRLLPRHFRQVSAVEPNADMRAKFQLLLPAVPCLAGTGEATGLPDHSVDLITVAQAFHWLDEDRFRAEAKRILRPSGKVAIIWNTSLPDDFTEARDRVCRRYCPRFRSGYAGKRSPAEGDAFLRHRYFRETEAAAFANPFVMDCRTFAGNMRSRSYALTPDHVDYDKFMADLRAVFETFSRHGFVTEPQETRLYLGYF